ncbi:hypothetical protein KFL_000580040 [Klebsormidium nitens]|uniref:Uncharacterized protein n=1 Tax=Klebsormidium nitens TaxID=105231 RepID=A0A1Y1HPR0_KLENI|nr:hypothetical protein KFL_000580040 [Klebsormidium nitens]|eukprot:GAQ80610.1 hypothetical protein KFL_000580040 [Klebsormidium nitens]
MASATAILSNSSCLLSGLTRRTEKRAQGFLNAAAPVVGLGQQCYRRKQLLHSFNPLSKPPTAPARHGPCVRAQSTAGVATKKAVSTKLEEKPSTLPEEQLIELAKKVLNANNGLDDPSLLADGFYFAAPIIYLQKNEFLQALGRFSVKDAFPDLEPNAFGFSVDPYEPNRVWFFTRSRATHTGVLNFGSPTPPTFTRVESPPEVSSITFNNEGKATRLTAGYVVDRRTGNTGGLGALFGILYAIGAAPPVPEFQPYEKSWQFALFSNIQGLMSRFKR